MSEIESVGEASTSHESSWRFRKAMEANVGVVTKVEEVTGWENYYKLPPGVNPVISPDHLTDVSVQVAASKFAKIADVGIASLQTNQENPVIGALESLAGKDEFYNIDNVFKDGKAEFPSINPQNFLTMARAANENHKTLIIASHSPHFEGYGSGILPRDPGIAAVIVANLTDRVVLPVVTEIAGDTKASFSQDPVEGIKSRVMSGRSESTMHIAEPIFLDKGGVPDNIVTTKEEVLSSLRVLNSESRSQMSAVEKLQAVQTLRKLKEQAGVVLMAQAAELPEERRGVWHARLSAQGK